MAIAFLEVKTMKRSDGKNAVAAAAYRAADRLTDDNGIVHDYTRKAAPLASGIVAPAGENAPERAALWTMAERAENRKDARVAREIVIALPKDATEKELTEMTERMAKELTRGPMGTVADWSIHNDHKGNPHAHILMPTRAFKNGALGPKLRELDMANTSGPYIEGWRQAWQKISNEAGQDGAKWNAIDIRSYERQGVDTVPQIKMGKAATYLERMNIKTTKGDRNRTAAEVNAAVKNINAKAEDEEKKTKDMARKMMRSARLELGLPADPEAAAATISLPRCKTGPYKNRQMKEKGERKRRRRGQPAQPKAAMATPTPTPQAVPAYLAGQSQPSQPTAPPKSQSQPAAKAEKLTGPRADGEVIINDQMTADEKEWFSRKNREARANQAHWDKVLGRGPKPPT